MGSSLTVSIVSDDKTKAEEGFQKAKEIGNLYETMFSRFIPESELSLLNSKKELIVSPLFLETVQIAKHLHEDTEGAFNPLVQIEQFGYEKDFAHVRGTKVAKKVSAYNTDFSRVTIDETHSHISIPDTQKFDFGGFLKGHVAQKMAEALNSFPGVIINLGGDIMTHGKDAMGQQFIFSIHNPINPSEMISLPLENVSIATSGSYRRTWEFNGEKFFHILDTDGKGNPKTDVISSTVISPLGAVADAYATVGIVLGSKKGSALLKKRNLHYILITDKGEVLTHTYEKLF